MGVTWEQALDAARAHFGESAYNHSVRTAETSAMLAGVYGVDEMQARIAGLLHDWNRELDNDALLAAARAQGVEVTPEYAASPRLLHAETGAGAVAREIPEVDDAILSAIAKHTVGSPQMSALDRVVYIADMIEDGRTYGGVDDLRDAVGSVSLEELFALAYRHTVMHVVQNRKPMHPVTVEVWNTMVARSRA